MRKFSMGAELLFEEKDRMINPKFGLMITSENSICSYIGFCLKQQLIYNLSLSFTFAPGLYYSFKEDKLGHILEFNSGIEVTYAVTSQNEISLSFHHISNGGLAKFNPGAEFILISYTIPLRR